MHQIQFRPGLREFTALLQTPSLIQGVLLLKEKEGKGKGEREERERGKWRRKKK